MDLRHYLTILRQVRAVRRRLLWIGFCRRLTLTLAGALALLALFVLAGRLVPLPLGLRTVAPWVGGSAAAWLAVWCWLGRVRLMEAALRADEALGLKERLSTTLYLRNPRGEAEQAVLEDAAQWAARIRPAAAFRLSLGRELRLAALPAALLPLLWFFMPQMNLLARPKEETRKQAEVIQVRQETVKELEKLAEEAATKSELREPALSQQVKREMAALAKKLAEQKLTGDQALAKTEDLKQKLERRRAELEKALKMPGNLESKGEGRQTGEMARQMQKGNFAMAAKRLEELKKKIQNNQLTAQEKAELQKELKALAAKLGKDSPLGEAMAQAAQKMEAGQMNAALAELEQAGGQMMDMEAMVKELESMQGSEYDLEAFKAAMAGKGALDKCGECGGEMKDGECQSCGKGPWKPGDERKHGSGMGGPGIGEGQVADKTETPTGFEKKRVKGDIAPGRIIAKMKVPGQQDPGQAKIQYESLRVEYAQQAEDTIQKEAMPLELKSFVREYYDAIKYEDNKTSK